MIIHPNTRRNWVIAACAVYLASIPFLLLVIVGNTSRNAVLSDIYFFRVNVAHIIPISVENASLLNSVARSLGLHDFYQVGLWNFCEGYLDEGVTHCSKPKQFYWFNPVEVLVSELLAGARIALPSEVITILHLLQAGSQVMYAFFMAGIVFNFAILCLTPIDLRHRWFTAILTFFGSLSALLLSTAAAIATVISVAAKVALTAQDQLNISADISPKMFAFMWLGVAISDVGFIMQASLGCCCTTATDGDGDNEVNLEASEAQATASTEEKKPGSFSSFIKRRKGVS